MTDTACVSARIARQVCCPVVMVNQFIVQHTGQGSDGNRASRRQQEHRKGVAGKNRSCCTICQPSGHEFVGALVCSSRLSRPSARGYPLVVWEDPCGSSNGYPCVAKLVQTVLAFRETIRRAGCFALYKTQREPSPVKDVHPSCVYPLRHLSFLSTAADSGILARSVST
jgi:hypothetical protein